MHFKYKKLPCTHKWNIIERSTEWGLQASSCSSASIALKGLSLCPKSFHTSLLIQNEVTFKWQSEQPPPAPLQLPVYQGLRIEHSLGEGRNIFIKKYVLKWTISLFIRQSLFELSTAWCSLSFPQPVIKNKEVIPTETVWIFIMYGLHAFALSWR